MLLLLLMLLELAQGHDQAAAPEHSASNKVGRIFNMPETCS